MSTTDKTTRPPRLRAISTPLSSTPTPAANMGPPRPSPLRSIRRPQAVSSVPLRVLHQEQLHQVDAAQLPHGAGVCLGHCRTDIGLCRNHPDCADLHCPDHPKHLGERFDVPACERDPVLLRRVLLAYFGLLGAVVAGLALWLTS